MKERRVYTMPQGTLGPGVCVSSLPTTFFCLEPTGTEGSLPDGESIDLRFQPRLSFLFNICISIFTMLFASCLLDT